MVGRDEICELLFEARNRRTEDVLGRGGDFVERAVDLCLDRLVLRYQVYEGDYGAARRLSRAGTPATIEPGRTSRVTTAPAPTMALAPIRTPPRMTEPEPSEAPFSTTVRSKAQSSSA
jgi:hypothetical protein